MAMGLLGVHDGLLASGRLPALARAGRAISLVEVAALILFGVAAAGLSVALPDLRLQIPGHAVLRSVFPMALGLAIVPRQWGGCIMGGSALATALLLRVGGVGGVGAGAITSLTLTGPLLDLALWGARDGWRLYLGFVLAGLASNLLAFGMRWGALALGLDIGGGGGFASRFVLACFTFPACGILAGLVSAAFWFHLRRRDRTQEKSS